MEVIFNKPSFDNEVLIRIKECLTETGCCAGNKYTKLCESLFYNLYKKKTIITVSCTAALELAALLIKINPGDEIIMPSYTFSSTANAFALRGGIPVFIDINPETINIDESLIEQAITKKTKAIVVVHYAGISCDMSKIMEIAKNYNLIVIEDAAHAFDAKYNNKSLGTIGDIGCLSFHETKNITSGEGGAIILNDNKYNSDAEIISEKGTNRQAFIVGEVDKYTWLDIGSSYKLSDINAALLYTQLEKKNDITSRRVSIWNKYYNFFKEYQNFVKIPYVPPYSQHNGHIFYIILRNKEERNKYISYMNDKGIDIKFHYIPLHSSIAGVKYGRVGSPMDVTDKVSDTLVRLPLFYDLLEEQIEYVCKMSKMFFNNQYKKFYVGCN